MGINLPYVDGTIEKLWRIFRSHKMIHFLRGNTLRKLLCKPKDQKAI